MFVSKGFWDKVPSHTTLPPITVTSIVVRALYTSPHVLPGSIEVTLWFEESFTAFMSSKEIVIPPSTLDAFANDASPLTWPQMGIE